MKNSFVFDYDRALIKIGTKTIIPRPKEMEMLKHLIESDGKIIPRETFLKTLWGVDVEIDSRTVDQHIARLRKHLGPKLAARIVTVPTRGYRYDHTL